MPACHVLRGRARPRVQWPARASSPAAPAAARPAVGAAGRGARRAAAPLQQRHDKGGRLAGAGARHAHHVLPRQRQRQRAALDGRRQAVALALDAPQYRRAQAHRLWGRASARTALPVWVAVAPRHSAAEAPRPGTHRSCRASACASSRAPASGGARRAAHRPPIQSPRSAPPRRGPRPLPLELPSQVLNWCTAQPAAQTTSTLQRQARTGPAYSRSRLQPQAQVGARGHAACKATAGTVLRLAVCCATPVGSKVSSSRPGSPPS